MKISERNSGLNKCGGYDDSVACEDRRLKKNVDHVMQWAIDMSVRDRRRADMYMHEVRYG
jgi:hypothetical protein